MIGLLVLGALVVWFFVAGAIAKRFAKAIPMNSRWQPIAATGIFIVVFLLPVADELAARPTFERWCHRDAVFRVDPARIKGRTVHITATLKNVTVRGALIPILHSRFAYLDVSSGEQLAEYDTYAALGGVLVRTIGFPPSHSLTGTFYCAPNDLETVKEKYGFVVVD
jgi:hypothetical protein